MIKGQLELIGKGFWKKLFELNTLWPLSRIDAFYLLIKILRQKLPIWLLLEKKS